MKIFIIWLIVVMPFVIYFVNNYRRATRIDRKLDRKAMEAKRREEDKQFEMNQRNLQLQKFRK